MSAAAGLRAPAAWVASLLALAHCSVAHGGGRGRDGALRRQGPATVFMGEEGAEFRRKRFVKWIPSLDDNKYIKNVMNCVRARLSKY
jgi:hypothetical protein